MTGQADDLDVVREVFATKLGSDTDFLRELQYLRFELRVTKGRACLRPRRWQAVQIAGGGQRECLHGGFGRGASDDERDVIGRAGSGSERRQLPADPGRKCLGIENGLGLLKEHHFVGGATALRQEEQLVGVALGRVNVDLRRQIALRVHLFEHRERRILGVAKVFRRVGPVDALAERFFIAEVGPYALSLEGVDLRRPGVLTARQDPGGRNDSVLEKAQGDETVVVGGLRVVEDVTEGREMSGAIEIVHIAQRFAGHRGERLSLHLEYTLALEVGCRHVVRGQQAIGRGILAQLEHRRVAEIRHVVFPSKL